MRRHAKASTAGSTQRQAKSLGRFIVAFALALALIPASASATKTRNQLGFSPITGSGTGVTLHFPSGIGVDEASGNVFLNDGGAGNVVDIFGAEGGIPTGVASPYKIGGFLFSEEPTAAAVDNAALSPSKGTLYVTDTGHSKLKKFVRNGLTNLYEPAGELVPSDGEGLIEPTGVAVDSKGNVFVTSFEEPRSVVKFSPGGAELARTLIPGAVGSVSSLAVDAAGDLFAQGYNFHSVYKYPANGSGEIEEGVFTQLLPNGSGATGVAVDMARNELLVGLGNHVNEYDATTLAKLGEFGTGALGTTTRIAVNSAANRVYVSDVGATKKVAVFGPDVTFLPTVAIAAASERKPTTATLNGTVNPEGVAVSDCNFEYGTTTSYGTTIPCEGLIPNDESAHPVSAALTGLTPGATYHFRLAATNVNGTNKSEDETFKAPNPVTTEAASEVKGTKATLNAIVRPEGLAVSECKFEYGTTTAYGASTPCVGAIPTDEGEHPVTAALTGLIPNGTEYHFRVVEVGGSGTVFGEDESFKTANTVITEAATALTGTKATLNGSVNPEGSAVSECKFEYGTTTAYGNVKPCEGALPTDESPHALTAALTNLQPNGQTYHFRIVVNGGSGVLKGKDLEFKTPDTVITEAATAMTTTSATLNGSVNPDGLPISECEFEYGTSTAYGNAAPCVPNAAGIGSGTSAVPVSANLSALHPGTTYHFRLKAANANGPIFGKDKALLTLGPVIRESWAQGITHTEATIEAKIDPEGAATTFHVEYGPTSSYGQSTPETNVASDSADHVVAKTLEGLTPGATYHYRVVATSLVAVNDGPDQTFTTFEPFAANTNCANQAFRGGASAGLPDCRAYEMVSPIDKAGANVEPPVDGTGYTMGAEQAALGGDKMAYATAKPFGDALSSLWVTEFIASRGPGGWSSHSINPPHQNNVEPIADPLSIVGRYAAFSEDLSTGFLFDDAKPPLTPDALPAPFRNFYLRDNDTETYEAITTQAFSPPPTSLFNQWQMGFMGFSKDGSHTLLTVHAQLTADANPDAEVAQLYDFHDGKLELASVLPNGEPAASESVAGLGELANELGENRNAISEDGSRIFWTTNLERGGSEKGKIYARIDGETTIPVSGSVTPQNNASYWIAAADGSKVIFSVAKDLYEFDVDTETPTLIAGEVDPFSGVLGASEDASSIYFVSNEALAPGATAGKPNLYLDREGTMTFIATPGDGGGVGGNNLNVTEDFSQVTPDGNHVVFDSAASLTGYDNTSLETGESATEVYEYDANSGQLHCISCNPSGGRPETAGLPKPHYKSPFPPPPGVFAAWLPTPRRGTYTPRMVRDDGKRIFFNAFDSLVPQDTNGVQDVYEWEAQGVGDCNRAAGCISLISTGESPKKSEFIDANEDGRDVFFRTSSSIDPEDPGLIDIYDAREGGGLPPRSEPPACLGDACQSPPTPPNDPTPSSAGFKGAGNPAPAKARKSCKARKGHAKKQKASHKRAKQKKANKNCRRNNRRAGR